VICNAVEFSRHSMRSRGLHWYWNRWGKDRLWKFISSGPVVRLWDESRKLYVTVSTDFIYRTALWIVTRNRCVVLTVDCSLLMRFAWKFPVVQNAPYPIHSIYFQFYSFHYLPLRGLYLSYLSVTTDTQYSRPLNLSWPCLLSPTFVTLTTVKSQCRRELG